MQTRQFQIGHHIMTWSGWAKQHQQSLDVRRALEEMRDAGYDAVELGAFPAGLDATTVSGEARNTGVRISSLAIAIAARATEDDTSQYRRALDFGAELGVVTVMVCGGFIGQRRTMFDSDYQYFSDNLASAQRYGEQFGQTLAFHPHIGCMVETGGEIDRLLAYLPDLRLTLDTGHLAAAGERPSELIRRHAGRVAHVHLKDFNTQTNRFAELGQGNVGLDFAEIADALREVGYTGDLIVERDSPPIPPGASARISREHLRSAGL